MMKVSIKLQNWYKGFIMFILKATGQRVKNGKLITDDIYISALTIEECFVELVRYKVSSDLYIKVDTVYSF